MNRQPAFPWLVLLWLALLAPAAMAAPKPIALFYDQSQRPLSFAAAEIRRAQTEQAGSLAEYALTALGGTRAELQIVISADPEASGRIAAQLSVAPMASDAWQSYSIRTSGSTLAVLAADPVGAMYGGLDMAEAIRLGTLAAVSSSDHAPYVRRRGIKFNIPLDARTPSYSDNSDAAQKNIPEMWSFDFWRSFLDDLARNRFNVLTLWSLHPFPSLVKVPEYPDIALDDVKRTTLPLDGSFSHSGSDMVRPAMLDSLETVRTIRIDEKIEFWRDVMQYAHDRGIEVYFFTWNIFTWGTFQKHGIDPSQDNPETIRYFRDSVREMVLTYPLLAGFGITAGEQMEDRDDEFSKERWLWKTYGEGIRDALKLQPGRDFRLIHRFHQTALGEILQAWRDYPSTFELSFKYAIAHVYSVPNPPFIKAALPYLRPEHPTWLTIRDDDFYSFRNGDPGFVRAFMRDLPPQELLAGFYMGPDGYVWGREFLSRHPETPRQTILSKRWYNFMLWGRLAYDPSLPDDLFVRTLAQRFSEVDATGLSEAWTAASEIFPQITRFFWGDIDLRWFPEACLSHPRWRGFYTVRDFIVQETMPQSGILNILDWRRRKAAGRPMEGITPLQVADNLENLSRQTLGWIGGLRRESLRDRELVRTLGDLEAMADLGLYYSEKIRGAAELGLFDLTSDEAQRQSALIHLRRAVGHWQRYASAYTEQYEQPRLYNRVGWVDIPSLLKEVERDVLIAELWAPGTLPQEERAAPAADRPFKQ